MIAPLITLHGEGGMAVLIIMVGILLVLALFSHWRP
jgi:hypothetical protein